MPIIGQVDFVNNEVGRCDLARASSFSVTFATAGKSDQRSNSDLKNLNVLSVWSANSLRLLELAPLPKIFGSPPP